MNANEKQLATARAAIERYIDESLQWNEWLHEQIRAKKAFNSKLPSEANFTYDDMRALERNLDAVRPDEYMPVLERLRSTAMAAEDLATVGMAGTLMKRLTEPKSPALSQAIQWALKQGLFRNE